MWKKIKSSGQAVSRRGTVGRGGGPGVADSGLIRAAAGWQSGFGHRPQDRPSCLRSTQCHRLLSYSSVSRGGPGAPGLAARGPKAAATYDFQPQGATRRLRHLGFIGASLTQYARQNTFLFRTAVSCLLRPNVARGRRAHALCSNGGFCMHGRSQAPGCIVTPTGQGVTVVVVGCALSGFRGP